jgi:hypothetical protein
MQLPSLLQGSLPLTASRLRIKIYHLEAYSWLILCVGKQTFIFFGFPLQDRSKCCSALFLILWCQSKSCRLRGCSYPKQLGRNFCILSTVLSSGLRFWSFWRKGFRMEWTWIFSFGLGLQALCCSLLTEVVLYRANWLKRTPLVFSDTISL